MVTFWQRLTDMLFPRACEVCGQRLALGDVVVCANCNRQLPRTYHQTDPYENEMAQLFWGRIDAVERCAAFMFHQSQLPSSRIIYSMKYRERPDIGLSMGRLMAEELLPSGFFSGIDGVVPIPLSKQKLRRRGYNQSLQLARGICQVTGRTLLDGVVRRIVDTESQTLKARTERADNMEGAFSVVDAQAIAGHHLLIVDDVVTTGATICSCVAEMQRAAQCQVSVLALAFTKG